MTVNLKSNSVHDRKHCPICKSCGQKLPSKLEKEVESKFKIMCDLWIKTLLESK